MTGKPVPRPSVAEIRTQLRAALKNAMKERDKLAVSALRSGLSAIDNAEAITTEPPAASDAESPIAGAAIGLGVTEAARRELTVDDVRALLRTEVEERREAATEIEGAEHPDRAADLRREADVLESVVTG
ncbi:hypothetical protein [Janibacter sp. HTCC2649]|uniref:hypothetical protein n=1 Tax=Janibacter sp. HTCC2649 TaxID=313589 RepID=UPI0005940D41|nr:hypothetical protein [Janibacter sp. HTCC2649]